jgi:transposase
MYNKYREGCVNQITKRKKFSRAYKMEIIKLVIEQGKKVTHVANDIGFNEVPVRRWVNEYIAHGESAFPGKGNLRPEHKELRKMNKKIADLEEENEILKKLYAFSRTMSSRL